MRHYFAIIFMSSLASLQSAAAVTPACNDQSFTHVGKIDAAVKAFDDFYESMPDGEKGIQAANEFLKKSGLPQEVSAPEKEKPAANDFPDRLENPDSPGGKYAIVFLKKMSVLKKSKFDLDPVYEATDRESTKSLREWSIPFNSGEVQAIDGDELIVGYQLTSLCGGTPTKKFSLAIKPSGEYRILPAYAGDLPKEPSSCKAGKTIIKDSAYVVCGELLDLKTKKKRVIIWQAPMT